MPTPPSHPADGPLLSILMPVYNERAYLRRSVERALAAPLPEGFRRELVIVEDGSKDDTGAIVREIARAHPGEVRVFFQERNQGKGAAIRRAIGEMRGDYAVFQDADLEYDPREYARLLEPILRDGADVVYGSRFAGGPRRRILDFHHELGNRFLTLLSNAATGLNLTDMETCYKMFRADFLRTIPLRSDRFGMEPEITAKIAKRDAVIYEVPVSYHGRGYADGKKIGVKDGFSAIWTIAKYWALDDCWTESPDPARPRARHYAKWQVDLLRPYLGERVLEVNAGPGLVSRMLPKRELLTVTAPDDDGVRRLARAFGGNDLVTVARLRLGEDADFAELARRPDAGGGTASRRWREGPARADGPYDTVVCLSGLEREEDDLAALRRLRSLLSPGGKLLLMVPRGPGLYGTQDRMLGYARRYTKAALAGKLRAAGFRVRAARGFDRISGLRWWWRSVVRRRATLSRLTPKFFNACVPVIRRLDWALPLPPLMLRAVAERD